MKNLNGQVCHICGEDVGTTPTGDVFVACNECGYPVCRDCYEYERKEGNKSCPQCKTRYKRLRGWLISLLVTFNVSDLLLCVLILILNDESGSGSPRVDGDDEEDDVDDIENEFNYRQGNNNNNKSRRQWDDSDRSASSSRREYQQPPLLTNGQTVIL